MLRPGPAPLRGRERVGEVQRLVLDLVAAELHDLYNADRFAAVVAEPGLGDPEVATPPDPARLEVEPGRVPLAPALDVGLAAEPLARLRELQQGVVVVVLGRLGLVRPARVRPLPQQQLADLLVD